MRLRDIRPAARAVPDLIVSATRSGDEMAAAADRLRAAVELAVVVLAVIAAIAVTALATSAAAIRAVRDAQ